MRDDAREVSPANADIRKCLGHDFRCATARKNEVAVNRTLVEYNNDHTGYLTFRLQC